MTLILGLITQHTARHENIPINKLQQTKLKEQKAVSGNFSLLISACHLILRGISRFLYMQITKHTDPKFINKQIYCLKTVT